MNLRRGPGRTGRILAILLAFVVAVPGVSLAQFSDSERRQGASAHPEIIKQYGGVYDHAQIGPYVAGITARIARASSFPNEKYTVTVLNSPVVNAFALPGGYVYVTRGLIALANSEAELASVIAHEIAHVTQAHGRGRQNRAIGATLLGAVLGIAVGSDLVNQIFNIGASGYLADYSRDQEREADQVGLQMLARAGYDPNAAPAFLASLGAQSELHAELQGARYDPNRVDWLASHPATGERVQTTRELAAQAAATQQGAAYEGVDEHFRTIDGILYGDDPKEGYVRGRRFIHPELRFEFEVPEGFSMRNSSAAVMARGPGDSQIKFDSSARGNASNMAQYITQVWARDARVGQIETVEINGIPAATGVTRVQGMDARLVAIDGGDRRTVYRFLIATKPAYTDRLEPGIRDMVFSFRRLSAAEAAQAEPLKLRTRKVRRGETVASLASQTAWSDSEDRRLRVLNGLFNNAQPAPGSWIKLVIE